MSQRQEQPFRFASVPGQEVNLLIADVAALTGVPPPQLRSWEHSGLLHPRRSPNAIRLYGIEDVARVRLIKRAVVNPGRRGSLRRLAARLASGDLQPEPEDYAGLAPPPPSLALLTDIQSWRAVVDTMADCVVVWDLGGKVTYINPALETLLASVHMDPGEGTTAAGQAARVLAPLPFRWAAFTGTQHRDVELLLRGRTGETLRSLWTVTPLRDEDQKPQGAVGVGRSVPLDEAAKTEDWLATTAHDLRGPVTNILGRLQLARLFLPRLPAAPDTEALDRHLAAAEVSTIDLIRTMDTLLDSSAAMTGSLIQHLEPEGVAIDALALQAVEHAQQRTTRHPITLEISGAPLLVAGDRVRLRQVLDNLLSNAVKFSPDGGPIAIQIEAVPAPPTGLPDLLAPRRAPRGDELFWALLRVSDTGLGMPPDAVPRVFDRYWRAGAVTHHIPGSGLGLYTSRAIVAAHGGHIWVERTAQATDEGAETAEWHGTVIAVLLPLVPPPLTTGASSAGEGNERS